jgi:hypothetical protein
MTFEKRLGKATRAAASTILLKRLLSRIAGRKWPLPTVSGYRALIIDSMSDNHNQHKQVGARQRAKDLVEVGSKTFSDIVDPAAIRGLASPVAGSGWIRELVLRGLPHLGLGEVLAGFVLGQPLGELALDLVQV